MRHDKAFTLLELLVTTTVTAILMLGISSLFIAFLNTAHKSKISQNLREDGNSAMQKMTNQLLSAKGSSISCTGDPQDSLTFINELGDEISFYETDDRLASASATTVYHLTTDPEEEDYLQNLTFRCFDSDKEQKYIEIEFTLHVAKVRPTTLDFKSGVVTRN